MIFLHFGNFLYLSARSNIVGKGRNKECAVIITHYDVILPTNANGHSFPFGLVVLVGQTYLYILSSMGFLQGTFLYRSSSGTGTAIVLCMHLQLDFKFKQRLVTGSVSYSDVHYGRPPGSGSA